MIFYKMNQIIVMHLNQMKLKLIKSFLLLYLQRVLEIKINKIIFKINYVIIKIKWIVNNFYYIKFGISTLILKFNR